MNDMNKPQAGTPSEEEMMFVEALASLLEKMDAVFGDELDRLTNTQETVLNGLLGDRIKARGGDPSLVTIDEVEGCRELLYTQFPMAAVQ
jgi:hypothetical protein